MAKRIKSKDPFSASVMAWVIFGAFAVYMLLLLIPYIFALLASVSSYKDYYQNVFPFPQSGLRLINFTKAWNNLKFEGTGMLMLTGHSCRLISKPIMTN